MSRASVGAGLTQRPRGVVVNARRLGIEVSFWGILAVAFVSELVRDWRVGDPPLPSPSDFFPLGSWGALATAVLGAIGLAASSYGARLTTLHRWLLAGLALMGLGVLVARVLPLPDVVPSAYEPFALLWVVLLGLGLGGLAVTSAQFTGRQLRTRLFWLVAAITGSSLALTAFKWWREETVTVVAIPDTPSIFPVTGLFWNPNILAMVLVCGLVVQLAYVRGLMVNPRSASTLGWQASVIAGGASPTSAGAAAVTAAGGAAGRQAPSARQRRTVAVLWLIGPLATTALLVTSLSRAGIAVGAVVWLVMTVPSSWWRRIAPHSTRARMLGLWLVAGALAMTPVVLAFFGGIDFNDRAAIWRRTWEAISARPVTGWGADSGGHQHAHNQLLESWQTGGALAIAGLVALVTVAVIAAVRFVSLDSRLALGIVFAASLLAGTEVFTPWRKFSVLPMALIIVVLALTSTLSLARDARGNRDGAEEPKRALAA